MSCRRQFPTLLLLVAIATGCQDSVPPSAESPPESRSATKPEPDLPAPVDPQHDSRGRVLQAMEDYVAPFPKRNNIFVAPKRTVVVKAKQTTEGTVQLRGVGSVGEPSAILDIEGAIALVPVGSEKYGVKVLSIVDKTVTLERGSNKWTASLDN